MANLPRGSTYVGVTNDLHFRIKQHKNGTGSKHVKKYKLYRLVYFETFNDIDAAITREKRLKRWLKPWKHELIEAQNPNWEDLTLKNLEAD